MGERDTDGRDLQDFHKFAFMHALVFFKIEMPHAEINADKDQRAADKTAHSGDARIGEIERAVLDPIVNRLEQLGEEKAPRHRADRGNIAEILHFGIEFFKTRIKVKYQERRQKRQGDADAVQIDCDRLAEQGK